MDRGTERNEARGEVGCTLHGELFISSTFTYSDPPLACAWNIDNACASFRTGLLLFKTLKSRATALVRDIHSTAFRLLLKRKHMTDLNKTNMKKSQ